MKQNVVFQVGLLAESPVTNVALERPGAIMDVHMAAEVPGGWEGLGAQRTLVGLLLQREQRISSSHEPRLIICFMSVLYVITVIFYIIFYIVLPCRASFCGSTDWRTP